MFKEMNCKFEAKCIRNILPVGGNVLIYCMFAEIYCWFEAKCTRNILPSRMKYIARLKLHQKYIAFSKKFPYRIHVLKK